MVLIKKAAAAMLFCGIILLAACQTEATAMSATAQAEEGTVMLQLAPLQSGEELAVLHTTMGDIKLRFFPEETPKSVENFITHAKDGYYDGVIFHRVIDGFMIQGGDPEGTGMGGESIWGGGFASEFSLNLRHFRGALAMAHSSLPDSNGSQFYIVQNPVLPEAYKAQFEAFYDQQDVALRDAQNNELKDESGKTLYGRDVFPKEMLDEYIKNGGTPQLDLVLNQEGHTVFGHVVEGMDVVDAIAAAEKDGSDKPLTDVVVESISFEIVP